MSQMSRQWRSLQELAEDVAFVARASEEFPASADALASRKIVGSHKADDGGLCDGGSILAPMPYGACISSLCNFLAD